MGVVSLWGAVKQRFNNTWICSRGFFSCLSASQLLTHWFTRCGLSHCSLYTFYGLDNFPSLISTKLWWHFYLSSLAISCAFWRHQQGWTNRAFSPVAWIHPKWQSEATLKATITSPPLFCTTAQSAFLWIIQRDLGGGGTRTWDLVTKWHRWQRSFLRETRVNPNSK